jgi:hypothetical protein
MKHLLIALSLGLLFASCSKGDATNNTNGNGNGGGVISGTLKFSGVFAGKSGYSASGEAKIFGTSTSDTLQLDNFSVSGGPDLKVYLSKADTPNDFINLGALRATTGIQNYSIPTTINFTIYKYVIIHCQQFNKVFAVAELKP